MATESELRKRSEFVSEVEDFLETCQQDINNLLGKLEWSEEFLLKKGEQVVCPLDKGHIIPKDTLMKHAPVCKLLKKGVPRSDIKSESQHSSQFFYQKTSQIGKFDIDKETLNKVLWNHHVNNHSIFYGQSELPLTTDDAVAMLMPGERAAVYSYIVQRAKAENKMVGLEKDNFLTTDFQEIVKKKGLEELNAKPKSYHEYLKAMRDYKRRRQSYRAKNVHITKKSYTEIIKEVIENQTEYLTEIIRQDEEENGLQSDQQKTKSSNTKRDLPGHETNKDKTEGHRVEYGDRNEGHRVEYGDRNEGHRVEYGDRTESHRVEYDTSGQDIQGEHSTKRRRSRSRERSRSRGRDRHKHKKRRRSREGSHRHKDLVRVKREQKDDVIDASVEGYHGGTYRSRSRDSSGSRKSEESHQFSMEEHSRSRDRSRSRHKKSRKKHKHKRHKSHKS